MPELDGWHWWRVFWKGAKRPPTPFYYPGFEFRGEWVSEGGDMFGLWYKIERRRLPPLVWLPYPYQYASGRFIAPEGRVVIDIPEPYRDCVTPGEWVLIDRVGPLHDSYYTWARPLYPIEENKA